MSESRKQELLKLFNEIAPIAKLFGMTLSYDKDSAVLDLPYNPNLDHALGGVHGGIYATMLDNAGWFTAAAAVKDSVWVATTELSIHFLKPVAVSSLKAVGKIINEGKRQFVAEMHLYDGNNQLVGHGTGTFLIVPELSTKV
ncbi:PaaI family thioesterase [Bdellovibrionota bacterium]